MLVTNTTLTSVSNETKQSPTDGNKCNYVYFQNTENTYLKHLNMHDQKKQLPHAQLKSLMTELKR